MFASPSVSMVMKNNAEHFWPIITWEMWVFLLVQVLSTPFVMRSEVPLWICTSRWILFKDISLFPFWPSPSSLIRGRIWFFFCHCCEHQGEQFLVLSRLALIFSGKIIRISLLWRVEWKCKQCFPAGGCFITLTDAFEFAWVADRLGYLCVSRTWKTRLWFRIQLGDEEAYRWGCRGWCRVANMVSLPFSHKMTLVEGTSWDSYCTPLLARCYSCFSKDPAFIRH